LDVTAEKVLVLCGLREPQASSLAAGLAGWQARCAPTPADLLALAGSPPSPDLLLLHPAPEDSLPWIDAALGYLAQNPAPLVVLADELDPACAARLEGQPCLSFLPPGAHGPLVHTVLRAARQSFLLQRPLQRGEQAQLDEISRVFESSQDYIFAVDAGYRLVLANPAFRAGWQAAGGPPRSPGDPLFTPGTPPDIQRAWKGYFDRALSGEEFTVQASVEWPDGERVAESRLTPLREAGGEVSGVLVVSRDITAQARLEQELERRVAQRTAEVQDLYDNAPAGYHSLDAGGRVVRVNQTELDWLGRTREEVLGRPFMEFLAPSSRQGFEQNYPRLRKQGVMLQGMEMELLCKDGSTFPVLASASAVCDEQGGFVMSRSTLVDMRQRKQAEQALRDSEARLREVLDNLSNAVYKIDLVHNKFEYLSPAFEQQTGFSLEEGYRMPGLALMEMIPEEERPAAQQFLGEMLAGASEAGEYEFRMLGRDGATRCLLHRFKIGRNDQGQPLSMSGSVADITRRKQVEQALRESEEKYRVLFQNELFAICIFDLVDFHFLDVNDAFVRLYGYSKQELVPGMTILDITAEKQDSVDKTRQSEAEGTIFIPLHYHRKKDGTLVPVEIVGGPYIWRGERVMFGLIHDISPRLQAEQALRESEATLNSFFNGIQQNMGIFRARPEINDLEFLRMNQVALKSSGLPPQALPGALASQHGMSEGNRRLWLEECLLCQESGEPQQFEYLSNTLPGRWMLASLNSIEPGVFTYAVADISELKRLQFELEQLTGILERRVALRTAELSQANRELERALRLRDELLHNLSHELRTPLTGILGISEALQGRVYGELSASQARAVETIQSSGWRLQALVDNLLQMAQLLAGKISLQPAPVHVDHLINACLDRVRPVLSKKRLGFQLQQDMQVEILLADEQRLGQILDGLLDNAVKFTPPGGTIGLEVSADPQAGQVRWVVWDTGVGIPPEEQGRIFDLFVQLDGGLARPFEGLGLGLALVSRLVDLHGGSINVDSMPGEGSRFTVILPLLLVEGPTAGII
jgi:PAS domain S-box-containing protein